MPGPAGLASESTGPSRFRALGSLAGGHSAGGTGRQARRCDRFRVDRCLDRDWSRPVCWSRSEKRPPMLAIPAPLSSSWLQGSPSSKPPGSARSPHPAGCVIRPPGCCPAWEGIDAAHSRSRFLGCNGSVLLAPSSRSWLRVVMCGFLLLLLAAESLRI